MRSAGPTRGRLGDGGAGRAAGCGRGMSREGTISSWNISKQYGFVKEDGQEGDYFLYADNIKNIKQKSAPGSLI